MHKYLAGECDEGEKQRIEAWLEADPTNREFLNQLQSIWDVTPRNAVDVDAWEAWEKFKEDRLSTSLEQTREITEPEPASFHYSKYGRSGKRGPLRSMLYAGAAAAAVLFAVLFYHQVLPITEQAERQFKTERTQQMRLNLADGSQIILNSESQLTVPPDFPDESREVYLEGEAYFDVQSNDEKPFIVNSEHTFVKVTGTKFGVRAYDNVEQSLAVVEEGEVIVGYHDHGNKQQVVLHANDLAILPHRGTDDRLRVKKVEKLTEYLGWRKGKLVFQNTPLRDVERRLERWYGIQVEIADSTLYDNNLTAVFEDEPLIEVLNVVALSLGVEYKRDDQHIIFH